MDISLIMRLIFNNNTKMPQNVYNISKKFNERGDIMNCLFCKIIAGEIPSAKVYEDEDLYAFRDIDPKAPIHILVIPKKHLSSMNDLDEVSAPIVSKAFLILKKLATDEGIDESGYRVVVNTLKDGGQSVEHLHFHLLGGRSLSWPPG